MSPNEPTSWIFSKETSRCACPYFAFDSWVPDQWKISTIIGCMRNTTTFSVPPSPWRQESLTDHNALVPDFSVSPPGHHQEPTVTPCFPWWSSHHLFLGVWLLAACTLLFFLTLLEERKSGEKKKKLLKVKTTSLNGFSNIKAEKLQLLSWHCQKFLVSRPAGVGMELEPVFFPDACRTLGFIRQDEDNVPGVWHL